MQPADLYSTIQAECSEYLDVAQECGRVLMRGMAKCPESPQLNLLPNQFTSRTGYDKPFFDKMVDTRLKRLKLLQRAEATFGISRLETAKDFGSVFYIFPKNGFRFGYAEQVTDLYPHFERWIRYEYVPEEHYCSEMVADLLRDAMGDLTIIDIYCERSPTFKKYIRQAFVEAQKYRGDDLTQPLLNEWEVWFDGPFHALPITDRASMDIVEALGLESQQYAA